MNRDAVDWKDSTSRLIEPLAICHDVPKYKEHFDYILMYKMSLYLRKEWYHLANQTAQITTYLRKIHYDIRRCSTKYL